VETQDGGDAKVEVSPRDIIYTQPAEPLEGEQPEILHKVDLRYGYELFFPEIEVLLLATTSSCQFRRFGMPLPYFCFTCILSS